jgi:hypothetical protein
MRGRWSGFEQVRRVFRFRCRAWCIGSTEQGQDTKGAVGERFVEGGEVAGTEGPEDDRVGGEAGLFDERFGQVRQVSGDEGEEVARALRWASTAARREGSRATT